LNLAKLSVFALVVFFLAVSPAAAQVGVDSGLWEFCDGSAIEPALVVVQGQQTGATGSGCIVTGNPQPEILTAAHVVDSDSSFTVSFHSGEVIRGATVRARDNEADVALLQCATPEGCSVLEVASEATEGEDVYLRDSWRQRRADCQLGREGRWRCFGRECLGQAQGENRGGHRPLADGSGSGWHLHGDQSTAASVVSP